MADEEATLDVQVARANDTEGAHLPDEIDLGGGHRWVWIESDESGWPAGDGLWKEPNCRSWHHVDLTSGTRHGLVSRNPLTIEGSLLCPACKSHGHIKQGRWVDV